MPAMVRCASLAVLVLLMGCQYDPHGNLYLTTEPKTEDIIGNYILDRFDLPPQAAAAPSEVAVMLHADGTFTATNIPPHVLEEPDGHFFSTLLTESGRWEKASVGTLDPSARSMWGVYLRTLDNRFASACFTGSKPPYGLIFTLGDPDSGHAVLLKRKL